MVEHLATQELTKEESDIINDLVSKYSLTGTFDEFLIILQMAHETFYSKSFHNEGNLTQTDLAQELRQKLRGKGPKDQQISVNKILFYFQNNRLLLSSKFLQTSLRMRQDRATYAEEKNKKKDKKKHRSKN